MKKTLAKFLVAIMLLVPLMSAVPTAGALGSDDDGVIAIEALADTSSTTTEVVTAPPVEAPSKEVDTSEGEEGTAEEESSNEASSGDDALDDKVASAARNVEATSDALIDAIEEYLDAELEALGEGESLPLGRYLVDITPTTTANNGTVSGQLAGMFHTQALVEVKDSGNYVSFFHVNTPLVAGFPASPANIEGYRYDTAQEQTSGAATPGLVDALREDLNTAEDAKVITVSWPDLEQPLFVHINRVVGHMGSGLTGAPLGTFMVLDTESVTTHSADTFLGFPKYGAGQGGQPTVDKAALQALITTAEQIQTANYTQATANTLISALVQARLIAANPAATQVQVDTARSTLQAAINGLVPRPAGELQVGRTYLIDITPTTTANNGTLSGLLAPLYHPQAVVEITAPNRAVVTFFHSNSPTVAGMPAPPSAVHGYAYDSTQMQSIPPATAMRSAVNERLDGGVRAITVNWPDVTRPLFVTIDHVPGMPADVLPAPTFMVLNPVTATHMTQHPFPQFAQPNDPGQQPVNRTALQELIARAERVNLANYTHETANRLTTELRNARAVLANPQADQRQVDTAYAALSQALNGLVRRPTGPPPPPPQQGTTYLMNILPTTSDNNGTLSGLLAPLYHPQAVVEITGGNRAVVTFFHSNSPLIASPGGNFSAGPATVYGYAYNPTQLQTRAAAERDMRDVVREELNGGVRAITVNWPDIGRPLFMTIDRVPGMPAELGAAPTFMVLDRASATSMTQHPFPQFADPTVTQPQETTVDKSRLRALVTRAEAVRLADYTELSADALREALRDARAVLNNSNATQRNVNTAHDNLLEALNGLVRRPRGSDTVDIANVTEGRFTVRVDFWHATQNRASMANDALNNTAIVDIRDGRMTMSISTRPIRVGDVVTNLGTLQVNGRNANVLARDLPGNRPSQFSFPLPNRNSFQPVVFWLDPRIPQTPRPDLPGRLRISWDTLRSVDAGTRLSGTTAVAVANVASLDEIEREAELTDEEAPEPVLGVAVAGAAESGTETDAERAAREAAEAARNAAALPWFAWAAIGLGIIGAIAAGWLLYTKKIAPGRKADSGVSTN